MRLVIFKKKGGKTITVGHNLPKFMDNFQAFSAVMLLSFTSGVSSFSFFIRGTNKVRQEASITIFLICCDSQSIWSHILPASSVPMALSRRPFHAAESPQLYNAHIRSSSISCLKEYGWGRK
ncbi:hypothetical protein Tcan_01518 [Toxocara canis]|uniref:Uncharacterized protein n=1 Tax=Toxocara canis TaxID=6265 RepID=A0A0B2UMD3_TOXCA|nr:hypothetical protein Tcan_01518 [Toxocara canis]